MKKAYLITAVILEILACAGAWAVQHFTAKKMGMLRWVNGVCNRLSHKADLDGVNTVAMLVLAAAVLLLAFWAAGRIRERSAAFDGLLSLSLCAAGIYAAYTAAYTRKLMAAYYLVSPVLLLGALLCMLCLLLGTLRAGS